LQDAETDADGNSPEIADIMDIWFDSSKKSTGCAPAFP